MFIPKTKTAEELVQWLDLTAAEFSDCSRALRQPVKNLKEDIIRNYLILQKIESVQKYCKEMDYRTAKRTLYTSKDIGLLIKLGSDEVPEILLEIAKKIQANTKANYFTYIR